MKSSILLCIGKNNLIEEVKSDYILIIEAKLRAKFKHGLAQKCNIQLFPLIRPLLLSSQLSHVYTIVALA